MATKKYERIAGSEDTLILREALEKLSNGSLSSSLEGKVDKLIEELRQARMQREGEMEKLVEQLASAPQQEPIVIEPPSPIDVEGIVKTIFELTNKQESKPSYRFTIERDHSGVLKGITATPEA